MFARDAFLYLRVVVAPAAMLLVLQLRLPFDVARYDAFAHASLHLLTYKYCVCMSDCVAVSVVVALWIGDADAVAAGGVVDAAAVHLMFCNV